MVVRQLVCGCQERKFLTWRQGVEGDGNRALSGETARSATVSPVMARTAGVSIVVGNTPFTVMPVPRSSAAATLMSVARPLIATEKAPQVTTGCSAALEPTTMIHPFFRDRISGITALTMLIAGKFTLSISSHTSSGVSSTRNPPLNAPTRCTRQSIGPSLEFVSSTAPSAAFGRDRSASKNKFGGFGSDGFESR